MVERGYFMKLKAMVMLLLLPILLLTGCTLARNGVEGAVCDSNGDCARGFVCLSDKCTATRARPVIPFFSDSVLRVGAAKRDITWRGFETHIDVYDPQNCPKNKPWLFDGYIDQPNGLAGEPCKEKFRDLNGNGQFDALWIGGFDNYRPATGVDEDAPIMARAFAVTLDGEYFVFVTLDFIGIVINQVRELKNHIARELGLDENRVIFHILHNHEGPDTQGLWGPVVLQSSDQVAKAIVELANNDLGAFEEMPIRSGVNKQYWDETVIPGVVKVVRDAIVDLRPAKVKVAKKLAPSATSNRITVNGQNLNIDDYRFDHENVQLPDFNGNGVINDSGDIGGFQGGGAGRRLVADIRLPHFIDHMVMTMQAVDRDTGKTIMTFVNYSNHVEAWSDQNTLLSADFAGYLCNYLERKLGGIGIYALGSIGALITPLRGVFVPKMDKDGNYLDTNNQVVPTFEQAANAQNSSKEKAEGLGRCIGRTAYEALQATASFTQVDKLKLTTRYAWVPLDNPFFYIGARINMFPGLSEQILGTRNSDQFMLPRPLTSYERDICDEHCGPPYSDADCKSVAVKDVGTAYEPRCGAVGCTRTDLHLIDLGPIRFLTNPGELAPEYIIGRKASSIMYNGGKFEAMKDIDNDGIPDYQDPEISMIAGKEETRDVPGMRKLRVTYKYPVNPQRFTAITGLRELEKERNGTEFLFVMGESDNTIGYLIPESDKINVFEGFLNDISDFTGLLGCVDLRQVLDMTESPSPVILKPFIADTFRRFPQMLADIPHVVLDDHNNAVQDFVTTSPRTGNIIYNAMCELLNNGACPTKLPVYDDPNEVLYRTPR